MSGRDLVWFRLRWPREVGFDRLQGISLLLASTRSPLVVEAVGCGGTVEHRLGVRPVHADSLTEQLRVVLPGLGLTPLDRRPPVGATQAVELRLSSPLRPLRLDQPELLSRAVLTALAQTRKTEQVIVQWQLVTTLAAAHIGAAERLESSPASLLDAVFSGQRKLDNETARALRTKRALPAWRCVGRVGVRAATPARARSLLHQTVQGLALADAPGVRLVARRTTPSRIDSLPRPWLAPLRLNSNELAVVSAWPVGPTAELPVDRSARMLPPARGLPPASRVIGTATFPGRERPVGLSPADGLGHLHVLGPTGTGKSTLLLNLIAQDIAAGRGVVVIEPKGDLVKGVLELIPQSRLNDIVLLDASDDERPVGLNPLKPSGRPPELVADELLGMFRAMYESSWGPRTNDILAASLLTLARTPEMTLCALPALLSDPGFRHRLVSKIHDPIGLGSFWAGFDAWSDAERAAAIAPSMNRVRAFLLRPQLRGVLGQPSPRFEIEQVFSERKILLVNLAKGVLGSETAALLGTLVLNQLWATALRRSRIPSAQRLPVFIYVDEVQDYLRLPTDLGDALVQARGLGVGFVLAHQFMGQLDPATRAAILSNARSRVCFQLAGEDARTLASGQLGADDLRELSPFHAYAQFFAAGAVRPWCSLRTLPPPAPVSDQAAVREQSRTHYGVERATVDAAIERLLGGDRSGPDDITPRRRANRGAR